MNQLAYIYIGALLAEASRRSAVTNADVAAMPKDVRRLVEAIRREDSKAVWRSLATLGVERNGQKQLAIDAVVETFRIGKGGDLARPTLEEVQAYCTENKSRVDPDAFFDHYESNGWMIGRVQCKDWRAALRNWEKNLGKFGGVKPIERKAEARPRYEGPTVLDYPEDVWNETIARLRGAVNGKPEAKKP